MFATRRDANKGRRTANRARREGAHICERREVFSILPSKEEDARFSPASFCLVSLLIRFRNRARWVALNMKYPSGCKLKEKEGAKSQEKGRACERDPTSAHSRPTRRRSRVAPFFVRSGRHFSKGERGEGDCALPSSSFFFPRFLSTFLSRFFFDFPFPNQKKNQKNQNQNK